MSNCVDWWSLQHLGTGIVLAFVMRSCCRTCTALCKYVSVFAMLALWEVIELIGRESGWSEPSAWWEHEVPCNAIVDVLIGMIGFVGVYSGPSSLLPCWQQQYRQQKVYPLEGSPPVQVKMHSVKQLQF